MLKAVKHNKSIKMCHTSETMCDNCRWVRKLRFYGRYFGYPKCCINEFVEMVLAERRPKRLQIKICESTGFIPCRYCSWQILTKKVKLDDLVENRQCKKPFRKHK
jgi:hypothetical protein